MVFVIKLLDRNSSCNLIKKQVLCQRFPNTDTVLVNIMIITPAYASCAYTFLKVYFGRAPAFNPNVNFHYSLDFIIMQKTKEKYFFF